MSSLTDRLSGYKTRFQNFSRENNLTGYVKNNLLYGTEAVALSLGAYALGHPGGINAIAGIGKLAHSGLEGIVHTAGTIAGNLATAAGYVGAAATVNPVIGLFSVLGAVALTAAYAKNYKNFRDNVNKGIRQTVMIGGIPIYAAYSVARALGGVAQDLGGITASSFEHLSEAFIFDPAVGLYKWKQNGQILKRDSVSPSTTQSLPPQLAMQKDKSLGSYMGDEWNNNWANYISENWKSESPTDKHKMARYERLQHRIPDAIERVKSYLNRI